MANISIPCVTRCGNVTFTPRSLYFIRMCRSNTYKRTRTSSCAHKSTNNNTFELLLLNYREFNELIVIARFRVKVDVDRTFIDAMYRVLASILSYTSASTNGMTTCHISELNYTTQLVYDLSK